MAAPEGARRRGVVSEVADRKFKPLTDPSPLSRTPVSPLNLYRTWSRVQNGPLKFLSAHARLSGGSFLGVWQTGGGASHRKLCADGKGLLAWSPLA